MNSQDFQILEKVKELASSAKPVRHARIARAWQREEVGLSFYPAVIIEPASVETIAWPEMPTWRYRLVRYSLAVLAHGTIGSRAHNELLSAVEAVLDAVTGDLTLGSLADDGPPLGTEFGSSVAATRIGPVEAADQPVGAPLAYVIRMASGYFPDWMASAATYRGFSLFFSGPHSVVPAPVERRSLDRVFNGLTGTLALDLGEGHRQICQEGRLIAATVAGLGMLEAQIEARIDGLLGTLVDPDGVQYDNCRMESFERNGPIVRGSFYHRTYTIRYLQLAR